MKNPRGPTANGGARSGQRRESQRQHREQVRLERLREQEHLARKRRITQIALWSGGAVVVGLIAWAVISSIISANERSAAQTRTIPGVVTFANLDRNHVNGQVTYPQIPPVGGNHAPIWLNCGIYTFAVHNENAVHSLEHGAVWITYQPGLSAADVMRLQNLVRGHGYVILSPYDGLPSPVVASAWGVQLKVNSAADPRLAQFIAKYEQGPQTPEPGAPCSGGTGTPNG
jgi:hypothetical protein